MHRVPRSSEFRFQQTKMLHPCVRLLKMSLSRNKRVIKYIGKLSQLTLYYLFFQKIKNISILRTINELLNCWIHEAGTLHEFQQLRSWLAYLRRSWPYPPYPHESYAQWHWQQELCARTNCLTQTFTQNKQPHFWKKWTGRRHVTYTKWRI